MTPNRFPTPCTLYQPGPTLKNLFKYPSFHWAPVLNYTLDCKELGLAPITGVILAGPPGNGRHTMALHLSGTLAQSESRKISYFLRVSGTALDAEDVSDVCKMLEGAMASPIRTDMSFVFLLDCPEDSRHNLAIQEFLRQKMAVLGSKIFPIIITRSTSNIIPDLQGSLTIFPFDRPDVHTREAWFQEATNGPRALKFEETSMNHFTLAQLAEGFTWRQMTDFRTHMRRLVVLKYEASDELKTSGQTVEQLLAASKIKLSAAEVRAVAAYVRSQGMSVPAAGAVSYVMPQFSPPPATGTVGFTPVTGTSVVTQAAANPAAVPNSQNAAAPAPAAGFTEDQKAQMAQQQDYHAHPEKMNFDQLSDIDDL